MILIDEDDPDWAEIIISYFTLTLCILYCNQVGNFSYERIREAKLK